MLKTSHMKRHLLLLLFFPWYLSAQDCMFENIVTEASACNEDDQYTIDFQFESSADGSFNVYLLEEDETYITTFNYGEDFYTIGPFDGYCGELDVFIFLEDVDDSDCAIEEFVDAPCCTCNWIEGFPDPTLCNEDGTFDVYLTFEVENNEAATFTVYVNGDVYGDDFSYEEPFVVVEDLIGDCETIYVFVLEDNEDPECSLELSLEEAVCCELECTITDLEYFDQICGEDGTYTTFINFHVENPGNDYFEVWIDDIYFDYFLLIELPVEIGPLSTGLTSVIDVCINDVEDCCASATIEPPMCPDEAECSFTELVAESGACNEDDQFYVDFEITIENPIADSFEVYVEGNYIENLPYGEESYTIGPLASDCSEVSTITLIDVLDSTCFIEQGFIIPCCDEDLACNLFDFFYETYACDENNQFLVDFEFDYENPLSDSFAVYINDDFLDAFDYGEDFYTIGPFNGDCETDYNIFIQDWSSELCVLNEVIDAVCCDEESACEIYDLEAFDLECISEESYSLYINFSVEGADNDFFDLWVDGDFVGFYSLEELPLFVDEVIIDGYTLIEVCINDNEDCCAILEVEPPNCEEDEGECMFDGLVVETYECDEEGNFLIDFAFEILDPDAGSFNVHINGDFYGNYPYGEGFYTIGPFDGDCETQYSIQLYDELNDGCTIEGSFGPVCCDDEGTCEIYDLEAFDLECISEESYSLYINFSVEGADNDFFDLWVDGDFVGFYSLEELPLFVDEVIIDGYTLIEVCINDNEDCCAILEVEPPNCEEDEGECMFDGLVVETYECDEEGNFLIDFAFEILDPDAGSFNVHINGDFYGNYPYGEGFYTIGPFDGDCETQYSIQLYDELNDGCTIEGSFGPVCCDDEGTCEIYDLEAFDLECISEESYSLYINFSVEGADNDFFDLWVDGDFVGFYSLEELPLFVDEVIIDGYTLIEVCINDNEDCCAILEVEPPNCEEDEGECMFDGLVVETYECDEEGNFLIDFAFEILDPDAGSFNVHINGDFYGNYPYGEGFYTIGPFDGDCETQYSIQLYDELNDGCTIEGSFGPVCCDDEGTCEIYDLEAFDLECISEESYSLYINFSVEGADNDFFDLWVDGDFVGFYSLEELPLFVDEVIIDGYTLIEVCINDNEDCCAILEVEPPNCEEDDGECLFTELYIETYGCDSDENFFIDFEFNVEFPDAGSFNAYVNGVFLANLVYGEDYYTVGPFDGDCVTEYTLYLEDEINNECNIESSFGPVCCEEEICEISELIVFDINCDDEASYSFYVDFEVDNAGNDFFEVWIDDEYYDYYLLEELPLFIDGMAIGSDVVLTICINDTEDCCAEIEVESPACESSEACTFSDLVIEISECSDDGLFNIDFWFDMIDPSSDSFLVYLNDDMVGTFTYGEDYYTISDLEGDCNTEYLLYLEDQSGACAVEDILGPVCCEAPLFSLEFFDNTIYVSNAPADFRFKLFQSSGRFVGHYDLPESGQYSMETLDASIYIISYEFQGRLYHKKILKH